ncbi:MAG: outer membrane protein assembly factor BamB [Burkholderiales bacterium]
MRGRAAALALLALTAGCFGGAAGPKPAALEPIEGLKAPRVLWRASVDAAGEFVLRPAHASGAVFAAARDGTVARLAAADGREAWRVVLDKRLSAGVGADGRTVAVATEEGEVLALEAASGELRWRARVSSEVLAPPIVSGELVIVRSADSRVHALAADDGKRRWLYQRTPAALRLRTAQGLSMREGLLFAGFSGGKLVALQRSNGALRWEATVAVPKGATELERVADVVGDPAVIGREVCAVAFQGRVACFDAESGNQLWGREFSSVTGVSTDARYAFLSDARGAVHALDRTNGRSLWRQDRLVHRRLTLPLPYGSSVALADLEGFVHLLSRESGAIVARAATDGSAVRAAPVALPGGILVQTSAGGLYALAF